MIRKGKASKPTESGKMVKAQEAENQIVIDFEVFERKPTDSDLLIPPIADRALYRNDADLLSGTACRWCAGRRLPTN